LIVAEVIGIVKRRNRSVAEAERVGTRAGARGAGSQVIGLKVEARMECRGRGGV
jgi:hypothetical protein